MTPNPDTDPAADSQAQVERPQRFKGQHGIAMQTVVITIVLLAIAALVAGVLFARSEAETARLDDAGSFYSEITDATQCRLAGGQMSTGAANAVLALTTDPDAFKSCHPPADG